MNFLICDYLLNNHFNQISFFYINNCIYSRNNIYQGNGGIFLIHGISSNFTILNSFFYQCSCSEMGGAIYFYCLLTGTNFELNKICVNECYSGINKMFQFAYIVTDNSINSKNFNNYISIINSNKYFNNNYHLFSPQLGNISLLNYNSSNNYNKESSSFYIFNPSNFIGLFCTLIKNNV